ncbi:haloacid dehalogenase-like domain-containing protein [Tanacetum coccineum]
MTSSLPKIIAEYAKSGKSSCKKCSEKIESKALRLGLKVKDPRGYDSVKWHHFKCFGEMGSGSGCEVEAIDGFEELKGSDQEKLKEMVSEGGHSSAKREGDDEPESDRGDLKKLKTDKDEEAGQDKKTVTDEKVMAEYAKSGRSSCKKCSEKIKSKSLRLGSSSWDPRGYENTKWYHVSCFFPRDEGLASAEIIEGFSDLKSSDQEKLKKLVTGGDYETDEDEEAAQEKKNAAKEKIIAEYAKSGRSSCKKCSEKIESKSLRLGFSSWDPRGFENTKWHHMDCFFPLDADLVSAEAIEGFSELKKSSFAIRVINLIVLTTMVLLGRSRRERAIITSSDQEKLKKLVTEGGQSSKKVL